ncbi:MAG: M4 family metallopeptidase [Planctomycetaceae bacterium]|nr:M4 family metallopeptidase [Planctomycetaceae bacterium]
MSHLTRCPLHCIVPPYIFEKMLESDNEEIRRSALDTLLADTRTRGMREIQPSFVSLTASVSGRRSIYDARNSHFLGNAVLKRAEGDDPAADESVNRLYDGLGTTRDFLSQVYNRNSLDNHGHQLDGYVHVGTNYNNAAWDGRVMRFGDGDGRRFTDFTLSLDVIAHELGHGVTQYTADLEYQKQPGALNESMSDVFGSLVKQWAENQTVDEADWLIGSEVFTPDIGMDALRSMSHPGEAYDNDLFGKDPQPAHMDDYYHGPQDNYGVHINSGIPNKAFHLTATALGGHAWEIAGQIWYAALLASSRFTQFQDFADLTYLKASVYGTNTQAIVAEAWRAVGIRISGLPAAAHPGGRRNPESPQNLDAVATLSKQIELLANQVKTLSKEMKAVKVKN